MGRLTKQYSSDHNKGRIIVQRDYNYDVLGQLTHLSGQTQLNSKAKNNSNTANSTSSLFKRNHQYDYDKVGRLTQHKLTDYTKQTGTTELFAFDPASNRVPITTAEDSTDSKTSKQSDRPTKLISTDKVISYTYDSHGRVLYKTIEPSQGNGALKQSSNALVSYKQSLQFYYNPDNKLTQSIKIEQQGANHTVTTTDYYYDAFSRRIHKSSRIDHKDRLHPSGKLLKQAVQTKKSQYQNTSYLWDGNHQRQESNETHVFTTVYEQDSFTPVARLVWLKDGLNLAANDEPNIDDNYFYEHKRDKPKTGIQIYHYHNDHLGTPNELTNQQGEVVWLADYEAWGNTARVVWQEQVIDQIPISQDELQPIRFQGQSFDTETGLHYNRMRYFDPDLSMFTTRDPIGLLGGTNPFQYAPNPTGWIDPFGLCATTTFYHTGQDLTGQNIKLSEGRGGLDFDPAGKSGFYVTKSIEQARSWVSNKRPVINKYVVSNSELATLNMRVFTTNDKAWETTVLAGRAKTLKHSYDAVSGPVYSAGTKPPKPKFLDDDETLMDQTALFTDKATKPFNGCHAGLVK